MLAKIFFFCLLNQIWGLALEHKSITADCYAAYSKMNDDEPFIGVANGVPAKLKEFPHLTAIGWKTEEQVLWGCGGSLVTTKHILTAAHCTFRLQQGKRVPPNVARMGTIELDLDNLNPFIQLPMEVKNKEEFAQQVEIIRVIPHPKYTSRKRYNDIALMELGKDITVTDFVIPICLWDKKSIVFTELDAAGFGEVEFASGTSPTLNKVKLTKTGHTDCQQVYHSKLDKKLPDGLIEEQHLCASDKTNSEMDTCQGDSGGPLEYKVLSKTSKHWVRIPVLVGLTSFGKAGCGTSDPAVYTRVSSYIDWIEAETKQNLSMAACTTRYEGHREKYDETFEEHDLPSTVQVLGGKKECSGTIIHPSFVLTSAECGGDIPKSIKTSSDQVVTVLKVTLNEGFALLKLQEEIKYIKRTEDELVDLSHNGMQPYIFKVGPTCIQAEQESTPTEYRQHRNLPARITDDLVIKLEQHIYNVSDCTTYLDTKETLNESQYECLSGKWFVPNSCHLEPSSFSITDDDEVDDMDYYTPIPNLRSYVKDHDSCGSILMRKVTNVDIEWMNSVIFK